MRLCPIERHSWQVSPSEGIALQKKLACKIRLKPLPKRYRIRYVAGVDVAFPNRTTGLAAVSVYDIATDETSAKSVARGPVGMPYIPGLLSFRECPLALQALSKLEGPVDLIMVDGQGMAHPRRLGFASHLGLWVGIPTIGCAKSLLCGKPEAEPDLEAGSWTRLMDGGEQTGIVYRTRTNVKPVYLSPGNLVDLDGILRVIKTLPVRFRLPEPVRRAHIIASQARQPSYNQDK